MGALDFLPLNQLGGTNMPPVAASTPVTAGTNSVASTFGTGFSLAGLNADGSAKADGLNAAGKPDVNPDQVSDEVNGTEGIDGLDGDSNILDKLKQLLGLNGEEKEDDDKSLLEKLLALLANQQGQQAQQAQQAAPQQSGGCQGGGGCNKGGDRNLDSKELPELQAQKKDDTNLQNTASSKKEKALAEIQAAQGELNSIDSQIKQLQQSSGSEGEDGQQVDNSSQIASLQQQREQVQQRLEKAQQDYQNAIAEEQQYGNYVTQDDSAIAKKQQEQGQVS